MNSSKSPTLSKRLVLLSIAVGMLFVTVTFVFAFASYRYAVASLALLLGGLILAFGYYHLVYVLPKMVKYMETRTDIETRINIEALRASFWLVAFGLVIIFVGLLYLMKILPWT
jgi:membrane protein YdbS with pleckstrin-like domain